MENQPKEKKFKQNANEEIRKLVEENEDNNNMSILSKEVENKKKLKKKINIHLM